MLAINKLPLQSHSRSVTPQADSYRAYPDESSDSDSDFPAPPDNLLRAAGFSHSQPTVATSSNMVRFERL